MLEIIRNMLVEYFLDSYFASQIFMLPVTTSYQITAHKDVAINQRTVAK